MVMGSELNNIRNTNDQDFKYDLQFLVYSSTRAL